MGIVYTLLVGIWLCASCMLAGVMLIAVGALLAMALIFAPVGLPMIAAGMSMMTLGTRYLVLDGRQF